MKAKLVKYPFDNKKYQWNQYKMGKEFEYTWFKSVLKDWESVRPYYTYGEIKNIKAEPAVYGTVDWDNLGKSYDENISNNYQGLVKDSNNHTSCLIQKEIPDTVPRKVVTYYTDADVWFSKPGTYTYNGETFEVTATSKLYYKITETTGHSYPHGISLTPDGSKIGAWSTYTTFYSPKIGNSASGPNPSETTIDFADGSTIQNDIYGSTSPGTPYLDSAPSYTWLFSEAYLREYDTSWKSSMRNPINGQIISWIDNVDLYSQSIGDSTSHLQEIKNGLWPGESYNTSTGSYSTAYSHSDIDNTLKANMADFVYMFPYKHNTLNSKVIKNLKYDWMAVMSNYVSREGISAFEGGLETAVKDISYNTNRASNGYSKDEGYEVRMELAAHMINMPMYRVDISTTPQLGYTEFVDTEPTIYTKSELDELILKTRFTDEQTALIMAQPESDQGHAISSTCFGTYNKSLPSGFYVKVEKTIYSKENVKVGNITQNGISKYYIDSNDLDIKGDEELIKITYNRTDYVTHEVGINDYNFTHYYETYRPSDLRIFRDYYGNHKQFVYWTEATAATDINTSDFRLSKYYSKFSTWTEFDITERYRNIEYTVLEKDIKEYDTNQTRFWVNKVNATISTPGYKKVYNEIIDNTNYSMTNPVVIKISDWSNVIKGVNQFEYYPGSTGFYRQPNIIFMGKNSRSFQGGSITEYKGKYKLSEGHLEYKIGYGDEGVFVPKTLIPNAVATYEKRAMKTIYSDSDYASMADFEIKPSEYPNMQQALIVLKALIPWGSHYHFIDSTFRVGSGDYYEIETWVPKDYNPISFNEYTAEEWATMYHYTTSNWNADYSPFAYCNDITNTTDNRELSLIRQIESYETIIDWNDVFTENNKSYSVIDSDGVETYLGDVAAQTELYDSYIGSIWISGGTRVTSTNKDEYPDGGNKGGFFYLMDKASTKFISYQQTDTEVHHVTLHDNRYAYPHYDQYNPDTSRYGEVVGTADSTNEDSIPDAYWTRYIGTYLGESIPSLGIIEDVIPPEVILGVPSYDKQVNTSDTLKYGTVASASLTFNLNMPVDEAMAYNNELLVLFYDFEHNEDYKNFGFFYIDNIEVLDEYTSHLTAHDEVYKLNKYADDFLTSQTVATDLLHFYHALLDFCGCCYDSHETISNGDYALDNIYSATKTTGIEVAHFVANIAPGFIHANQDGDVVLQEYTASSTVWTISDYTDLKYNAYNSDILDKVRIVNNNTILGEDSGVGEKIYYLKDNPLIHILTPKATVDALANAILDRYKAIPIYRPATVHFLVKPEAEIGDVVTVVSQTNQAYNIAIMRVSVNEGGLEMESLGTATFPIEADSNAQLSNIANNIDEIHTDITDIGDNITDINEAIITLNENDQALDTAVDAIGTRLTAVENAASLNTNFRNNFSANNSVTKNTQNTLATVKINGTNYNNFALKDYVDNQITANSIVMEQKRVYYMVAGISSPTLYDHVYVVYIHDPNETYGLIYTLDSHHLIFTKHNDKWWYGELDTDLHFDND